MSLDYAMLGFLADHESSGYDLKTRWIDGPASHFWTADQAQIYRTLERLQRVGHLRSRTERQRGKPDRRVYQITPAGREALDEWLSSPHEVPPYRDPFLIQLRFLEHVPDAATLDVLEAQRRAYQTRLDELRDRAADFARPAEASSDRARLFQRMTIDAAITHARSMIDWLDDCIDAISALSAEEGGQRRLFPDRQGTGGAT